MAITSDIKEYLDKNNISYQVMEHDLAYTAMEIAGAQHVPGKQFVKSVIVKTDNEFVMCVLPAIHNIDFESLKELNHATEIRLAREEEIRALFPECECAAEPPFGSNYGIKKVFIDETLLQEGSIFFNGGTHTDVIKISCKDYLQLEKPIVANFGIHVAEAKNW